jgi:hypothetical protein
MGLQPVWMRVLQSGLRTYWACVKRNNTACEKDAGAGFRQSRMLQSFGKVRVMLRWALLNGSASSGTCCCPSQTGQPSPFSPRGPGPLYLPKPELSRVGGKCHASGGSSQMGDLSLDGQGKVAEDIGLLGKFDPWTGRSCSASAIFLKGGSRWKLGEPGIEDIRLVLM